MLDFRLFAVKSMKFSLTRFSKIQVYMLYDPYLGSVAFLLKDNNDNNQSAIYSRCGSRKNVTSVKKTPVSRA